MLHLPFFFSKTPPGPHPRVPPKYSVPLSPENIEKIFQSCADLISRPLAVGGDPSRRGRALWLDGMVSSGEVAETVLRPLTDKERFPSALSPEAAAEQALQGRIYACTVRALHTADEAAAALLNGCCLVFFPADAGCLSFEVKSPQRRGVEQPSIEKTVKGARDAFSETLRTNTALVRRKLRTAELRVEQTTVGRKSGTTVALLYLEGVADPALPRRLREKLDALDVDGLLSAGGLEEYLTECPASPFPQMLHTERPDKFAADLLQGRIGLLVDGLPLGFLLPATLPAFLRVGEDTALHWTSASMVTLLRYLALVITLVLPALYVAIAMYHQEMIPLRLLQSVIRNKQQVPFSTATEILGMLAAFELLQEAGLRLPDPIGQTVSIIGALIVGQSAVEASVISPIAVIIVAVAGICGYVQPSQDLGSALRLCRFVLVLAAIAAGMAGLVAGVILLVYHLAGLSSLGVSYLAPLDQGGLRQFLRSVFRPPLWTQKTRPQELHPRDRRRQK